MNKIIRIIPRLDIKNGYLIKGINLEGLRILGDPMDFSESYYSQGADEISYIDNVATLYGTKNIGKFIKKTSKKIFVPLAVGGGIKNINDVKETFDNGADKICINSAVVKNLKFLEEAAKIVGSANICVNIEYIKIKNSYFVTTSQGRDLTNINPIKWSKIVEDHGAGEVVLTSINHEGMQKGFDKKNIKIISQQLKIPVIAHGGAGNFFDFYEIIKNTNISGVMAASFFHYDLVSQFKLKKPKIGNTKFLETITYKKSDNNLSKLKKFLKSKNIKVRI